MAHREESSSQQDCPCNATLLYHDKLSPQSRSCYMLIKELGVEVELRPIDLKNGEHIKDSHGHIIPFNAMPTLIDNKIILSDGHTIMIYLCDKYAGKQLPLMCPRDYLPRLNILNMLFYEGCVLYRRYIHLLVMSGMTYKWKCSVPPRMCGVRTVGARFYLAGIARVCRLINFNTFLLENWAIQKTDIFLKKYPFVDMSYHQRKVLDCYRELESNLKGQLCMTGNCLTIADFSVVSTLSGLDLMFPITPDRWPNLYRWFENIKNMDSYDCNVEGIRKLAHLLKTEGQFPLPSHLADMRSAFQIHVDIDKDTVSSSKLKDKNKFKEIDNLSKKTSHIRGSPNSGTREKRTENNFSKYFPKVRTKKNFFTSTQLGHNGANNDQISRVDRTQHNPSSDPTKSNSSRTPRGYPGSTRNIPSSVGITYPSESMESKSKNQIVITCLIENPYGGKEKRLQGKGEIQTNFDALPRCSVHSLKDMLYDNDASKNPNLDAYENQSSDEDEEPDDGTSEECEIDSKRQVSSSGDDSESLTDENYEQVDRKKKNN